MRRYLLLTALFGIALVVWAPILANRTATTPPAQATVPVAVKSVPFTPPQKNLRPVRYEVPAGEVPAGEQEAALLRLGLTFERGNRIQITKKEIGR